MSKKDKKQDDSIESLLEEKPETITENKAGVTLDQIAEVLTPVEDEKPKRRKRRSKAELDKEKEDKNKEIELMLKSAFAFALVGLTEAISILIKADKWKITDTNEADFLASATIQYLNVRFPRWQEMSPELNLAMSWSLYFVKRLKTESIPEDKEDKK